MLRGQDNNNNEESAEDKLARYRQPNFGTIMCAIITLFRWWRTERKLFKLEFSTQTHAQ